jgi:hypothetical protein
MNLRKKVLLASLALALTLVAAQCLGGGTPQVVKETVIVPETIQVEKIVTQEVVVTKEVEVEVVVTAAPEPVAEVMEQPVLEVPFLEQWLSSGHADAEAEAFIHWDEDDPAEVPPACARCHSTPGFAAYIGADGSEAGVVNNPAPIGTTVECVACHNDVTLTMDSVVMPSGIEITGLGREARCMQCHQGRHSTVSVNAALEEAGVTDEDTVSEDLGFLNIHYFAAAATKYGTVAMGGYQYEGNSYDANFAHVEAFDTCAECHNPHTLEVRVAQCQACHAGVASPEDLKNVRMPGSLVDYDGDGDVSEGVYFELDGLRALLYQALQAYGTDVVGTAVVYDTAAYPYFFIDTDANGQVDEGEAVFPNQYNAWTPRLLKAAYNYQVASKDPGAFAHGGKYIIQLLYDSIADLNAALSTPIDLSTANRIDDGHFAGSEEAFRHWDEDGAVPGSCSKCHSATGLPLFLAEGVTISQPLANGFQCSTCHNDLSTYSRYEVAEVEFPSGAVVDSGDPNMNLCMQCHQGRTSKVTVDRATEGLDDDVVAEGLGFLNIHYFAAGATRFGTEVKGAYEYDGQEYVGFFPHVDTFQSCTQCHSTHGLDVKVEACGVCHEGVESKEDLHAIRISTEDYDGDGDTSEGMFAEIDTMRAALYAAIQDYGTNVAEADIVYESHTYPYFFTDTNANGEPDPDEANFGNSFSTWTPRLLRAAYNYQYSTKDPGAFAHNGKYILQILYDGLVDLDADVSGMVRP